ARTRQGRVRRLTSAQRWAIAASVLVALTLSAWWFTQWRSFEQTPAIASVLQDVDEQLGTEKQPRLERNATAEPGDKTAAAEQAPQSDEEESAPPARSNRIAMQTEKRAQSVDTVNDALVVDQGRQEKLDPRGAVAYEEPARTGV